MEDFWKKHDTTIREADESKSSEHFSKTSSNMGCFAEKDFFNNYDNSFKKDTL